MTIANLPTVILKPVKHGVKIGDAVSELQPTVTESCILVDPDGSQVGLFLKQLPPELQNLVNIADAEVRSNRVPKSTMRRSSGIMGAEKEVQQYSAILGSCPPKPHMRRPYPTRSSIHSKPSASTFVRAMLKAGKLAMGLVLHYTPEVHAKHLSVIESRIPDAWRFTPYFSSTISNCNIAAPIHQDNANVKGAVNLIITKRQNSTGGNLYVPDYDATFDQTNNSLLVYPAWRNMHGVTPIVPTHPGGYRNSHVWYALDSFANY